MTEIIEDIFNHFFPGNKVISTKVLGRMEKVYALAKELREVKKLHRYYKSLNEEEAKKYGEHYTRKTIKKRKSCFMGTLKYDAEDYYLEKIETLCNKISKEKVRVEKSNAGFAFVSFQSNLQVKKCLQTSLFKRLIMESLSPE